MKSYRPLLLESLRLRVGPFRVHRLRLNRHIDETSVVTPHQHPWSQLLIYLSGQGEQVGSEGRARPVRSGTVALFPPRTPHAFRPIGVRLPICLVVDFDLRGAGRKPSWIGPLPEAELAEVRRALSGLIHLHAAPRDAIELQDAALVLGILDRALRSGGWLPSPAPRSGTPEILRRARTRLAEAGASSVPVAALARSLGYHKDHLNRLLRRAGGMTLGQLRASQRLEAARRALLAGARVGAAAAQAGFDDANYFSRWFRRQTGLPPRRWRERQEAGEGKSKIASAYAVVLS